MKPPYAIGSVPSLSGHAIAYRWRSPPRVRRHRASKRQGSSERVLPWQIAMDQLIFASLSHTHYWYDLSPRPDSQVHGLPLSLPGDDGSYTHGWILRSGSVNKCEIHKYKQTNYRQQLKREIEERQGEGNQFPLVHQPKTKNQGFQQ